MKIIRNLSLLLGFIALFACAQCLAQDAGFNSGVPNFVTPGSDEDIEKFINNELALLHAEQGKFLVSATKSRERISKAPAIITVITDEEINNMGARNLIDVLRRVPGLGVTQNNLFVNEIEVRGIKTRSSEKILMMVDGHYLDNDLINGGGTDVFDTLPLENVKKIEITRGPASAMYGANAFLAMIHIFTKNAEDVNGFEASIKRGSYLTEHYNVLYGKNIKGVNIIANLSFFDTDGFGADVEQDILGGAPFATAPDETDQFGKRRDLDLKLDYNGFRFRGKYAQREDGHYFGATSAIADETKTRYDDYFLEVGYNRDLDIIDDLNLDIRLYRDFFHFDNDLELFPEGFPDPTGIPFPNGMLLNGEVENTKMGGEILTRYKITDSNTLISGAMAEHQKQFDIVARQNFNPLTGEFLGDVQDLSDTIPWTEAANRDLWALYFEDLWDITEDLRLTIGARYDRYNDFGGEFNPRLGLSWRFLYKYDLKLLYGHGFRAPTFAELHNINNPVIIGNSGLDPEEIETIEASVGGAIINGFLKSKVTFFRNDIHDLIGIDANNTIENAGSARIHGIELEMLADFLFFLEGGQIKFNYTYQHPKDRDTNRRIADVPTHKANIMADFDLTEHFSAHADLFIKDSTPRAPGDTRGEVPGYALFNTSFAVKNLWKKHKIFRTMELRASVYNVFDKKYQDPSPMGTIPEDYNMPRRSAMFEVSFSY